MRQGLFEQQVVRHWIARLVEAIQGGQAPGKLEMDRIDLDVARAFTEAVFAANKRSLDNELPAFDQNFVLAQKLCRIGRTKRRDMPVINDHQVREFQARLKDGHLDLEKPLSPYTEPKNPWPQGLQGEDAVEFVRRGLDDENLHDDKVKVSSVKVKAKELRPIQRQIYLDKSMGATGKFGVAATKQFLGKSLMILSEDQFIIDGHHRWTSALIVDPQTPLPGVKIGLPISKLLPVSLAYGDAIGNKRNL